jgi:hypothetical protein
LLYLLLLVRICRAYHIIDSVHRYRASPGFGWASDPRRFPRATAQVEEVIRVCEVAGVGTWLAADFIYTSIARLAFEIFGSHPMLVFRSTSDLSWSLFLKRVIDFCGALCSLVVLGSLMIVVAIAVKLKASAAAARAPLFALTNAVEDRALASETLARCRPVRYGRRRLDEGGGLADRASLVGLCVAL